MVILELNKVRSLDVLLTSGDQMFSKAIRACTTLARGGRLAQYSHAALFISPALILEALFREGTSFTNLIEPRNRPGRQSDDVDGKTLVARFDEGRLRLFAILEGESGAAVFRHKEAEVISLPSMNFTMRSMVFKVLLSGTVFATRPSPQCISRSTYPGAHRCRDNRRAD